MEHLFAYRSGTQLLKLFQLTNVWFLVINRRRRCYNRGTVHIWWPYFVIVGCNVRTAGISSRRSGVFSSMMGASQQHLGRRHGWIDITIVGQIGWISSSTCCISWQLSDIHRACWSNRNVFVVFGNTRSACDLIDRGNVPVSGIGVFFSLLLLLTSKENECCNKGNLMQ